MYRHTVTRTYFVFVFKMNSDTEEKVITENIKIYCRVRPQDSLTGEDLHEPCVKGDPDEGTCVYKSSSSNQEYKFQFDGYLGPQCSQLEVLKAHLSML